MGYSWCGKAGRGKAGQGIKAWKMRTNSESFYRFSIKRTKTMNHAKCETREQRYGDASVNILLPDPAECDRNCNQCPIEKTCSGVCLTNSQIFAINAVGCGGMIILGIVLGTLICIGIAKLWMG